MTWTLSRLFSVAVKICGSGDIRQAALAPVSYSHCCTPFVTDCTYFSSELVPSPSKTRAARFRLTSTSFLDIIIDAIRSYISGRLSTMCKTWDRGVRGSLKTGNRLIMGLGALATCCQSITCFCRLPLKALPLMKGSHFVAPRSAFVHSDKCCRTSDVHVSSAAVVIKTWMMTVVPKFVVMVTLACQAGWFFAVAGRGVDTPAPKNRMFQHSSSCMNPSSSVWRPSNQDFSFSLTVNAPAHRLSPRRLTFLLGVQSSIAIAYPCPRPDSLQDALTQAIKMHVKREQSSARGQQLSASVLVCVLGSLTKTVYQS